jgi:formimidoylglutamate deiminase
VAEELRMLEYSQRLRDRTRNALADGPLQSTGRSLFDRALAGGAQALGQPMGAIAVGRRADIVVLNPEDPGLMGRSGDAALDSWIFSVGNRAVKDVYCGGHLAVRQGRHINAETIRNRFLKTVERLS